MAFKETFSLHYVSFVVSITFHSSILLQLLFNTFIDKYILGISLSNVCFFVSCSFSSFDLPVSNTRLSLRLCLFPLSLFWSLSVMCCFLHLPLYLICILKLSDLNSIFLLPSGCFENGRPSITDFLCSFFVSYFLWLHFLFCFFIPSLSSSHNFIFSSICLLLVPVDSAADRAGSLFSMNYFRVAL